jgi:hypothetical protein
VQAVRSARLMLFVSFAGPAACSTSARPADAGPACVAYDAGTFDRVPPVSLKTDVMQGVFAKSCSLSTSCHGAPTGSQQGLFLGKPSLDGGDSAAVRATLVGASTELPGWQVVTPGDPGKSYLMHKIDGDQCLFDTQCTGGSCTGSMPSGSELLPVSRRDVVRLWIAQGAQDN